LGLPGVADSVERFFAFFAGGVTVPSVFEAIAAALPEDLADAGVRNRIRAGVDRDVARKIVGHKTDSIFSRYNITETRDQVAAFERLDAYLATEREKARPRPRSEPPGDHFGFATGMLRAYPRRRDRPRDHLGAANARFFEWARQASNLGPTGYEPAALTN
jgi:hypothetical protein